MKLGFRNQLFHIDIQTCHTAVTQAIEVNETNIYTWIQIKNAVWSKINRHTGLCKTLRLMHSQMALVQSSMNACRLPVGILSFIPALKRGSWLMMSACLKRFTTCWSNAFPIKSLCPQFVSYLGYLRLTAAEVTLLACHRVVTVHCVTWSHQTSQYVLVSVCTAVKVSVLTKCFVAHSLGLIQESPKIKKETKSSTPEPAVSPQWRKSRGASGL